MPIKVNFGEEEYSLYRGFTVGREVGPDRRRGVGTGYWRPHI